MNSRYIHSLCKSGAWFLHIKSTKQPFVRNESARGAVIFVEWWDLRLLVWSLKIIISVRIENLSRTQQPFLLVHPLQQTSEEEEKNNERQPFSNDGHRIVLTFAIRSKVIPAHSKCLSENYHFVSISSFHQHQFHSHLHIFTIFPHFSICCALYQQQQQWHRREKHGTKRIARFNLNAKYHGTFVSIAIHPLESNSIKFCNKKKFYFAFVFHAL